MRSKDDRRWLQRVKVALRVEPPPPCLWYADAQLDDNIEYPVSCFRLLDDSIVKRPCAVRELLIAFARALHAEEEVR